MIYSAEYIVVCKPHHMKAKPLNLMRSCLVVVLLTEIIMICTIHLNNQFGRQTDKVYNIVANDELSAKRHTHLVLLQMHPQHAFCFCGTLSHSLSMLL